MFEVPFVRTIAERFVLGHPAPADADDLSSAKIIYIAFFIPYLKISFDL